jgi:hypothetical protein
MLLFGAHHYFLFRVEGLGLTTIHPAEDLLIVFGQFTPPLLLFHLLPRFKV